MPVGPVAIAMPPEDGRGKARKATVPAEEWQEGKREKAAAKNMQSALRRRRAVCKLHPDEGCQWPGALPNGGFSKKPSRSNRRHGASLEDVPRDCRGPNEMQASERRMDRQKFMIKKRRSPGPATSGEKIMATLNPPHQEIQPSCSTRSPRF